MADITMDDLGAGAIVYDVAYDFETRGIIARKIEVLGPMHKDGYMPMLDHSSRKLFKLFPGDRGIAPVAYDKRVTQVFHTYEEAKVAIEKWGDTSPNFIVKD